MPEITVIITTYNLQDYIDKCLQELFAQTFQDFDILIVDDCSSDNTQKIISQWKKRYPDKFKTLFLSENLGLPAKTRNAALNSGLIGGNYIIFLDGDDSIEPQMLDKMYRALVNSKAGVAICAYDRVDAESGHVLCTEMRGFPKVIKMPPENDILAFINTSPWNKLWRKDILGEGRFPEFKVGEEVALFFSSYTKCEYITFVDEVLIHYCVRKDSVISNTSQESIIRFADELKTCYQNQTGIYQKNAGVIAFLHIGISMALRAADNKAVSLKQHLKWTRNYLATDYNWFKNNDLFKLKSFIKHGMKGMVLWICFWAYRMHVFGIILSGYKLITKLFRIDVKF